METNVFQRAVSQTDERSTILNLQTHGIFPFVHAVSAFIPPTFVSRKISPVGIGKFSMNVMVLANHSDVNCDDESKIDSTARLNPAIYIYIYTDSEVVC